MVFFNGFFGKVVYENYYAYKIIFFNRFQNFLFNRKNSNLFNSSLITFNILLNRIFKNIFWPVYKYNTYKSRLKSKSRRAIRRSKNRRKILFWFLKNNYFIFIFYNKSNYVIRNYLFNFFKLNLQFKKSSIYALKLFKRTIGEGVIYIRGLFIIFFIDACFTDDEPLWEPIEWSLVQTWILFIFIFAWIAENLITSRYGSYTGRDKRVWFAWYKTFWLIELSYLISYALAATFVIVPFYYELTYSVSFIFSWWNWYTRVFFFKFISIYSIVLLIAHFLLINIRWLNWKKAFFFVVVINVFLAYLLYTQFIMTFFGYFTDPLWYQKTRFVDYIQLSHEPLKWGWGPAKRDHFTYHKVSTVFWFKNDGPFAGAFLMFHMFFFLSTFFLYLYWLVLLRKIYQTKEFTYTFTTFCVSALKQFYYFFFLLYILIFMSFIVSYWRFPIEFIWMINSNSWFVNFSFILKDYAFFVISVIF